jgi:hypothetical protein
MSSEGTGMGSPEATAARAITAAMMEKRLKFILI